LKIGNTVKLRLDDGNIVQIPDGWACFGNYLEVCDVTELKGWCKRCKENAQGKNNLKLVEEELC
tara:strand:+ start:11621 stop:11812 length:192 start_codon:yes stop_codon:yes gene_type:complete